ncbi:MAG TPA: hypothetical protein VK184_00340 [Nostocaceae cyanobacterium]|nr:hypothetical protein [Nostocaceae cyanobacterium]
MNLQTLKDNRKTALDTVINALNRKFPHQTWSKAAIQKKIDEYSSKNGEGMYNEYCQYIMFHLKKRLN